MENLLNNLKLLLQRDERLVSEGEILKNKVIELALKLDKGFIKLLLSDKKMKEVFFVEVDGTLIFDKDKFVKFVSNKQFLPDSYTAFKNKIGLIDEKGEFISEKKEVVLSWPYKDCVLEGGMTKEDQKRDEIFWNEILAPDEISRLFDAKVFTNAKRIDAKGEHLPAPRRFYVYVIRCENDSFYIGQTDDINKRWLEHKQGKVEWTRKYKPIEIVHYEEYETREQAVRREKELKTGFGRKWIKREFKRGRLQKWDKSVAARQAGKFDSFRTDENGDIKDNLIIKGNNLLALHSLKKRFAGKIKLIYIDPPYNTGNDEFKYNDAFNHSTWLVFMKNRLEVARDLLKNNGAIFISCDDNEQAYLKVLCDEVFRRENFVTCLVWKSNPRGRAMDKFFATTKEYILVYAKDISQLNIKMKIIKDIKKIEAYKYKDEISYYKKGYPLHNGTRDFHINNRPNLAYSIYYNPDTKDAIVRDEKKKDRSGLYYIDENYADKKLIEKGYIRIIPKINRQTNRRRVWRWSMDKFLKYYKTELLFIKENGGYYIYQKERLSPEGKKFEKYKDIIENIRTDEGGLEIEELLGEKVFTFPKPSKLLKHIFSVIDTKNSIILDFFAGSGTTGQAVLELNKEDGGNRRFILCEQLDL